MKGVGERRCRSDLWVYMYACKVNDIHYCIMFEKK